MTEGLHYSVTRITIIQKYLGINASFTSSYQYKKTRFAPLIINYAGSSCFIKTKRLLTSGKKFLPSCDCCLQPSLKIPDSVVMDSRHHKEGKTTVRFSINSSRKVSESKFGLCPEISPKTAVPYTGKEQLQHAKGQN